MSYKETETREQVCSLHTDFENRRLVTGGPNTPRAPKSNPNDWRLLTLSLVSQELPCDFPVSPLWKPYLLLGFNNKQ